MGKDRWGIKKERQRKRERERRVIECGRPSCLLQQILTRLNLLADSLWVIDEIRFFFAINVRRTPASFAKESHREIRESDKYIISFAVRNKRGTNYSNDVNYTFAASQIISRLSLDFALADRSIKIPKRELIAKSWFLPFPLDTQSKLRIFDRQTVVYKMLLRDHHKLEDNFQTKTFNSKLHPNLLKTANKSKISLSPNWSIFQKS